MFKLNSGKGNPGAFRPFEDLGAILESRYFPLTPDSDKTFVNNAEFLTDPEDEENLFMEAMSDVKPISRDKCVEKKPETISCFVSHTHNDDSEALSRLKDLIDNGEGFVVADTSEYIEGTGYNVSPEIVKRLHRGDFSIQGFIDLHGFGVDDAREAFDSFFKDALVTGKRAVMVIHGRGLSSPVRPILKSKVQEWLTSGSYRKWVMAFSSARSCDGGAGATYVLLRERPCTKKNRKKKGVRSGK
ncbi:MAG: DNA mismatch repair protein MutS [Desulfobacteraceae bacterium]|nr:DNA mismatch repair protein MutS [Desulfobacteraceae bacterium]